MNDDDSTERRRVMRPQQLQVGFKTVRMLTCCPYQGLDLYAFEVAMLRVQCRCLTHC